MAHKMQLQSSTTWEEKYFCVFFDGVIVFVLTTHMCVCVCQLFTIILSQYELMCVCMFVCQHKRVKESERDEAHALRVIIIVFIYIMMYIYIYIYFVNSILSALVERVSQLCCCCYNTIIQFTLKHTHTQVNHKHTKKKGKTHI